MAFPISPSEGQIHSDYIYNSAKGAWMKLSGITSGSNSDGDWLRLPDGTQICYGMIQVSGSGTEVEDATGNYPMPFISPPIVDTTMQDSFDGGDGKWSAEVRSKTSTNVTVSLYYANVSGYNGTYDVGYIAVGKYK